MASGEVTSKSKDKSKKRKYYSGASSRKAGSDAQGSEEEDKRRKTSTINALIGAKGFIVTCDIGRERRASRQIEQAIRDLVASGEDEPLSGKAEQSVAENIEAELNAAQEAGLVIRCHEVEMKKGFFLVTLENSKDVNPVQLASAMLRQVLESKHSLAPECVRVVPLQHFCCCSVSAIKLALEPLLSPALQATGAKEASYAVAFKRRFSETPRRAEVLDELVPLVQALGAKEGVKLKVDLSRADFTVVIEVYKSIAGVSVVESYKQLKEFNMRKAC